MSTYDKHRRISLERWPYIWAALCVVFIVALAGMSVAYFSLRRSASTANCLQETLQGRSGPTANDQQAHVKFAEALDRLVHLGTLTPAQAAQERAALQKAIDSYVHTLVNDQAYRNGHAFTRC